MLERSVCKKIELETEGTKTNILTTQNSRDGKDRIFIRRKEKTGIKYVQNGYQKKGRGIRT